MKIQLEITKSGCVRMLHDDHVDLRELGTPVLVRASHVEYDNSSALWVVTSAKTGLELHRAQTRAEALSWEKQYYSPSGAGWAELTGGK